MFVNRELPIHDLHYIACYLYKQRVSPPAKQGRQRNSVKCSPDTDQYFLRKFASPKINIKFKIFPTFSEGKFLSKSLLILTRGSNVTASNV